MNEYGKLFVVAAATAIVTGIASWMLTGFTDQVDAGAQAQIEAIAERVYEEKSQTDTGKTVKQEISVMRTQISEINVKQDAILRAVEALAE